MKEPEACHVKHHRHHTRIHAKCKANFARNCVDAMRRATPPITQQTTPHQHRDEVAHPGIYLGRTGGLARFSGPERSTLVLGPTRSGKTSSLIIPNLFEAAGAVVTTSTKADVLAATARTRRRVGSVLVFDPSASIPLPQGAVRIGFSPIKAAATWDDALLMADALMTSTRAGDTRATSSGVDHWSERAASLLAPLLLAASTSGKDMRAFLDWVDLRSGLEARACLAAHFGVDHRATAVLDGLLATDSRELSGIWSTASGMLGAYRSDAALASTEGPSLDAEAFCESRATLYLCAPGRRQQLFAPILIAQLTAITEAAYKRPREAQQRQPVLFALDEVANIAPLPDLPSLISEGAGQGVLTLACLQDLSQARHRWGARADGFLSLFPTTMVLPGIADVATLTAISSLVGDHTVVRGSIAETTCGRRSMTRTLSQHREPKLSVADLAHGVSGSALVLDHTKNANYITLTPAHRSAPYQGLLEPLLDAPRLSR